MSSISHIPTRLNLTKDFAQSLLYLNNTDPIVIAGMSDAQKEDFIEDSIKMILNKIEPSHHNYETLLEIAQTHVRCAVGDVQKRYEKNYPHDTIRVAWQREIPHRIRAILTAATVSPAARQKLPPLFTAPSL